MISTPLFQAWLRFFVYQYDIQILPKKFLHPILTNFREFSNFSKCHPFKASQMIQLPSTNSAILSDCSSSLAGTRDNSSASDTEESLSGRRETVTVYKCTCGWTGDEFWSYDSDGCPLRNHICQRPRAARNLKQTHLSKEASRTVDMGDYYDGFKRSLYKDEHTQVRIGFD